MRYIILGKRGSKRRIEQIRWTRWEVIQAVALTLLAFGFSLWVGFWVATHNFD
jgi:heme/copper-type cytochrome/quinol oxidase subunit 1